MAVCGHLAPNGEKSILYDELYQKYGESKAHDIWEQIRSQQFLNKYGDWVNHDFHKDIPFDVNGEPTTEWVEKTLPMPKVLSSYQEPIPEPIQVEDGSEKVIAALIKEKELIVTAVSKPVFILNKIKDSVALRKTMTEEISHKGETITRETTISKQQSAIVREFNILEKINDCLHA